MRQTERSKVPFVATNVGRCICPKCPVQSKSQCVSAKLATIADVLRNKPLKREDIPGLYCSVGTATCEDIDSKQSCICGNCPIFAEYRLIFGQPVSYYCRDGSAI